jgi:hypothetical protein
MRSFGYQKGPDPVRIGAFDVARAQGKTVGLRSMI